MTLQFATSSDRNTATSHVTHADAIAHGAVPDSAGLARGTRRAMSEAMIKVSANAGKITLESDVAFYGLLEIPRQRRNGQGDLQWVARCSVKKKLLEGVTHSNLDPTECILLIDAPTRLAIEIALGP